MSAGKTKKQAEQEKARKKVRFNDTDAVKCGTELIPISFVRAVLVQSYKFSAAAAKAVCPHVAASLKGNPTRQKDCPNSHLDAHKYARSAAHKMPVGTGQKILHLWKKQNEEDFR